MKTAENIKLTTVGQLLGELKKYEEEHWDLSVVAWAQDDLTLGVVGMGKDKDGDLQIEVEEVEEELEGIWTVSDVIDSLDRSDKGARVYLAGHGLYFAIDSEGGVFTESDDDDVVGCYATVFGEYKPAPQRDGYEERLSAEIARKEKRRNRAETLVLVLIVLGTVCWLGYNIYALITGVGAPLWEKILWIVGCGIVLVVCSFTLYYSRK